MNTEKYNTRITWIVATILFLISIILIIITQNYKSNKQKITISPTPVFPSIILTPSPTSYPVQEAMRLQTQADENWGRAIYERTQLYPWLDKLPLQTDDYFVYFDVEKKIFVAKIYGQGGDNTVIKKQIILALNDLGIDAENYGFIWK